VKAGQEGRRETAFFVFYQAIDIADVGANFREIYRHMFDAVQRITWRL
jgi:hypothetical protein